MEEDIEDAKKIIDYCRNKMNFKDVREAGFHEDIADILENLINKNKELEEKCRIKIIGKYGDVKLDDLLKDNYIPKSKVKEILNKLDEEGYWEFLEPRDLEKTQQILQGLLQEGDDK